SLCDEHEINPQRRHPADSELAGNSQHFRPTVRRGHQLPFPHLQESCALRNLPSDYHWGWPGDCLLCPLGGSAELVYLLGINWISAGLPLGSFARNPTGFTILKTV